jgi:hypothetical protein
LYILSRGRSSRDLYALRPNNRRLDEITVLSVSHITQENPQRCHCSVMTDREDHAALMRDRAARLLAVALKARDDGNDAYAEELTRLASEAIDEAADLENAPTETRRAPSHIGRHVPQPSPIFGRPKDRRGE